MRKITLPITNFICCGSTAGFEKALLKTPGIQKAEANFVSNSITVHYNQDEINEEGIKKAILGKGFQHEKHQFESAAKKSPEKHHHPEAKKSNFWQRFKMNMMSQLETWIQKAVKKL